MTAGPHSLLIVDDTPENIDLLISILNLPELQVLAANSGERALAVAERKLPDLILLDVMMPGIDGFETCRRLRANPATQDIPVVFVTARTEDVATGFSAGGTDYITKPVQADEVRARVHHHLERRRLTRDLQALNQQLEDRVRVRTQELVQVNRQLREEINERRFMQDRLSYLATHDFVTRLYNRDALETHTLGVLAQQARADDSACLVIVELARFRIVNETCGYIAGDELLRQVADMLSALSAPDDLICRLGGDRFAILCRRPSGEVMAQSARLKTTFERFEFSWDGRSYRIDARIAVVPIDRDFVSFDQLMTKADEASYLVRRDGGHAVRMHRSAAQDADSRESVNWAYRLMDALKSHHFRVYFQQVVSLQPTDTTPGLRIETLVRMWDPETCKLVLPASFIGPAERYQLIDQLDRWMLREVLSRLSVLPAVLAKVHTVSINLSAYSLRNSSLADHVLELIKNLNFPAHKLCFEITESEAIVNLDAAKSFMERVKRDGVRFALDDFGTGFASFGYLKQLPFDVVKIDGAFVHDMDTDAANAAMVSSMVSMAQALNLPVVAEFVEREPVADRLRALGVQYGQGYLYHRPQELTETNLARAALRPREAVQSNPRRPTGRTPRQANPPKRRFWRGLLGLLVLATCALLIGVVGAWFALAPPGVSPGAAWDALAERTPSQWIRYAKLRLEGHTKLETIALPVLHAAQRTQERPVPDGLPDLGKGQRPMGLTAQRFGPSGLPQAATPLSQAARPPLADRQVASMEALTEALQQARAGEVIELAPGTYRWQHTAYTRAGGRADTPIVLRAQVPGTVMLEVSALQALVVQHPYWVIENLHWRGVCKVHNDCEHALHVVGAAVGTVLRNNHMSDFNAHVKVNGEGGRWPDGGLLQFNTLTNTAPRSVVNRPVTPFDLVGASAWVLRDNLVTDFVRPDLKSPSYGLFMKGGGSNGRIEHNLVICTRSNISQLGTRVGISLGGGLTGPASARPGPDFTFEHQGGVVQHNVVAHCNEAGLDSNRAVDSVFADNILVNTSGILLRGGSQARVERNRLDGGIRTRDTSKAQLMDNAVGDTRSAFSDADRLDLRPR